MTAPDTLRNPLGLHALVLTDTWDTAHALTAVRQAAELGYDLIEVPMLQPDAIDLRQVRRVAHQAGIGVRCSLGLPFHADISSEDAASVARGEQGLLRAVRASHELECPLLTGVIYSALGKYGAAPTARGWRNAVNVLARVADAASDLGMTLGLEVVNRYESNVLNTVDRALEMIEEIGRPNVVIHLDTYHMNIEEGDFFGPTLRAGDLLGYVHVGESHRGYLGSGLVDFSTLFRALSEIRYKGPITFEGFSSTGRASELSNTLAVWRRLWQDPVDAARSARAYLESLLAATSDGSARQSSAAGSPTKA